ncbi:MAG: hypothetical protein Q9198_000885 [Flavoplaca austrocitrina]
MKLLTVNFLTCAVKNCKSSAASFPLHFEDAELEQREIDYNPTFLSNILPRLDWDAITTTAVEVCQYQSPSSECSEEYSEWACQLGFTSLPTIKPEGSFETEDEQKVLQELHTLLMETEVIEGKMVCHNCGHEYRIKEGIANFLLPNHLGESDLSSI